MSLQRRLDNLPVGRKLLAALLVLLATVLLAANLAFISAAYWISQQSMTPQAMQTLARLLGNPTLSAQALGSPEAAKALLDDLRTYQPLRAAALYGPYGERLAQFGEDDTLQLPAHLGQLAAWRSGEFRTHQLSELPQAAGPSGHLLLVASSELPGEFWVGTLSASAAILAFSLLLWMLVNRQVRRLVTRPLHDLEELARRVTREENYALRAAPGNQDELGSLAAAFNTMLSRMQARERQLERTRDEAREAYQRAHALAEETRHSNRQLELEVQVRGKIERQLTSFQNYLNSIIDSMPSALIALDQDLFVTQWNKEAARLSGTSLEQALNQPVLMAFPQLAPCMTQLQEAVERHRVERIERISWPQGDELHHYTLTLYPLAGGAGRGVVIRIDDITQRLAMEEAMVQSEKMLSVGGLAAGMAHEINNPLGAILHNVQNIRRRLSADLERNRQQAEACGVDLQAVTRYLEAREIPRLLDGIQSAGSRAARIVSHMLSFSRRSNRELTPASLPQLIDQAVEIAGNDFTVSDNFDFRAIRIERDFDPQLGKVPCITNELEQVLLNLLKNAAQAIHQRKEGPPGRILLRTRLNPPWAEIQVEDNGVGMPEGVRKRIFEPFFTTKEVGDGTGLGLSVSYFIITNNHKGQMEVASMPGQGTQFTLRLPLAEPPTSSGL